MSVTVDQNGQNMTMERCGICKEGYFKSNKGGCFKKNDNKGTDCAAKTPDCRKCKNFNVDPKIGDEQICTECNHGYFRGDDDQAYRWDDHCREMPMTKCYTAVMRTTKKYMFEDMNGKCVD